MKVAVIMGSDSDYPALKPCIATLGDFGIEADVHVMSAHRSPEIAADYAKNAKKNNVEVIIAAAGKAAHLAGVIAGHTTLPVIGIPIKSSFMDGMDSLLSTVQMPEGIPVATVAVNGAKNAALLAVQILSLKYPALNDMLEDFKEKMLEKVVVADSKLREEIING